MKLPDYHINEPLIYEYESQSILVFDIQFTSIDHLKRVFIGIPVDSTTYKMEAIDTSIVIGLSGSAGEDYRDGSFELIKPYNGKSYQEMFPMRLASNYNTCFILPDSWVYAMNPYSQNNPPFSEKVLLDDLLGIKVGLHFLSTYGYDSFQYFFVAGISMGGKRTLLVAPSLPYKTYAYVGSTSLN